jgi:hypothetical protein
VRKAAYFLNALCPEIGFNEMLVIGYLKGRYKDAVA